MNFQISKPNLIFDSGLPSSTTYQDIYFNQQEPIAESLHNFIDNANIVDYAKKNKAISILELGLGTGLNLILTIEKLCQLEDTPISLYYTSIEKHPLNIEEIKDIHSTLFNKLPQFNQVVTSFQKNYPILHPGFHKNIFQVKNVQVHLLYLFCDAPMALEKLTTPLDYSFEPANLFDVVYLDGFNRKSNEEMWSNRVITLISQFCKTNSCVVSFSITGQLKSDLRENGYEITRKKGFGNKHQCLHAQLKDKIIENDIAKITKKLYPWHLSPKAMTNKKITIIGAGLAGCSIAYSLAIRGYKVFLYDSCERVAMKTSSNIAGVVHPILTANETIFQRLSWAAFSFAINRFGKMQQTHDINWNPIGVLQLAKDQKQVSRFSKCYEFFKSNILDATKQIKLVGRSELEKKDINSINAIEYLKAGSVSPKLLCEYLASHKNIIFRGNCYLKNLEQIADTYQIEFDHPKTNESFFVNASSIVLATANNLNEIKQTSWLNLRKNWGQVAITNKFESDITSKKIICHKHYSISLGKRQLYGATKRLGKNDLEEVTTVDESNHIIQDFYQQVFDKTIDSTRYTIEKENAGCRVSVDDHLPLIGALPNEEEFEKIFGGINKGPRHLLAKKNLQANGYYRGLYTISALGSRGILYSQLGAELLAAQINNEPLPLDVDIVMALAPSRTLLRKYRLKKN